MRPPKSGPLQLYQASYFSTYSERLIHGFTGKPFSYGGPDTPKNPRSTVLQNRQNLLTDLNLPTSVSWEIPEQVHGHRIGRTGDQQFQKTDGIVLIRSNHPVMLLFADCVPVILYDPVTHSGAVVHAGWRGTAQCIAKEAVLTLQNTTGAQPENMIAAIGPAIDLCCFQVSKAVALTMAESMDCTLESLAEKGLLQWDADIPDNPRLGLKEINQRQLQDCGIQQIEILPQCTYCQHDDLFSFRRGDDGRNSAFLMLR